MEFAAPAWDPYRVKEINLKFEMVQRRAVAGIVTAVIPHFAKSDYRRTTIIS